MRSEHYNINKEKAFTIVELIIVIAVLGVLAAILIVTLPSVIDKANLASALSDARNMVTRYECYAVENGYSTKEVVIFVEKNHAFYVFGYSSGKKLKESVSNSYDAESHKTLFGTLVANGGIVSVGDKQGDITKDIDNNYKNTAIYEGYRLMDMISDLTINEGDIYVGEDENYVIKSSISEVTDLDNDMLIWKSNNESAARVENGIVSGVAPGEAVITVSYGNKSATCKVSVIGYTDFGGTLVEMQKLIENPDIPLVMLRFAHSIEYVGDTSFLPITIKKGIRVRINTTPENLHDGGLSVFSDDSMDTLFVNDGGSLYLKSNQDYAIDYIDRRTGKGTITMPANIIVNQNGGYVELCNVTISRVSYLDFDGGSVSDSGSAIKNIDGKCVMRGFYYYSYTAYDRVAVGGNIPVIYNGASGILESEGVLKMDYGREIDGIPVAVGIENHGQCNIKCTTEGSSPKEKHGKIAGKTPILNYGSIGVIENVEFITPTDGIGIDNVGKNARIERITDCDFNTTETLPSITRAQKYCMQFSGGASIGRIEGGNYSCNTEFISADEASEKLLKGVVVGKGYFSVAVKAYYIANGHSQHVMGDGGYRYFYVD